MATLTALVPYLLMIGVTALAGWFVWAVNRAEARGWRDDDGVGHDEYIAELVKLVEEMIPEGKADGFDAPKWVARWLDQPQPALSGKTPRSFLDTPDGRSTVRRLLAKLETGAYG